MQAATLVLASRAGRRRADWVVPTVIIVVSLAAYCLAAVFTHQNAQISVDGLVGLMQRTVALGIVALGQTFAILVR